MRNNQYSRTIRFSAIALIGLHLIQVLSPMTVYGNSSISSMQGDFNQDFSGSSSGNGQMVDLFTGDFNYTIPLLSVDGFPLTISYSGNVSMHQDASWVGLGWSLNTGAINRDLRGLPDDFDGDEVTKEVHTKANTWDNWNFGAGATFTFMPNDSKSFLDMLSFGAEIKGGNISNSLLGNGFNFDAKFTFNAMFDLIGATNLGGGLSLGISHNRFNGIMTNEGAVAKFGTDQQSKFGLNTDLGVSSTATSRGSKSRTVYTSIGGHYTYKDKDYALSTSFGTGGNSHRTFGTKTYLPTIPLNTEIDGSSYRLSGGYFGAVGIQTFLANPLGI
jgi:hypothetical protein